MKAGDNLEDKLRKKLIREELKKKNGGESIILAKYRSKYPESAEREYIRLINEYMSIEKQVFLTFIPELKIIIQEGSTQFQMDSQKENEKKRKHIRIENSNIMTKLSAFFDRVKRSLENAFGLFDIKKRINKIAKLTHKLSMKEWKKTVDKTLGINLLEDYYSGDVYEDMLQRWVSNNVELIKTIPHSSLGKMKELIYDGYMSGRTTTNIIKDIQTQYGRDKRHATLIARDQTAKLNAEITQYQQRDAGIEEYEWSTSGDIRVRDSHKQLNGKIFHWNAPPVVDKRTGRRCHPGEDYQCRCCALAVFNFDTLDLPV